MPLTVAIPPTIQLQATYQATSTTNETSVHLDEDEAIDVFLISWGADIHGWRLEKPSNVAHVLSNVTSIILQRASDGAPLRLSESDRVEVRLPIGVEAWPRNAAAGDASGSHAARQLGEEAGGGGNEQCYGFPLRTCNDHGTCLSGSCLCEHGYVAPNCTHLVNCQRWVPSEGRFSSNGCTLLRHSDGEAVCSCVGLAGDLAVMMEDTRAAMPPVGCMDSMLSTFTAVRSCTIRTSAFTRRRRLTRVSGSDWPLCCVHGEQLDLHVVICGRDCASVRHLAPSRAMGEWRIRYDPSKAESAARGGYR